MSLKKISISARLILVMSLIAILTAGLSAYLIIRFIDSGEQVKVLAEEGTQGIIWGEKANFYLHNLIINFYRANSGDMQWVQAMEDNIPNIRSALNEYAKTATDPKNKDLLYEAYEALVVYADDIRILGQSFRQGIYGPDIIEVLNRLDTKPHANRLITAINNLVEYSKAMAEKNRASFFSDMADNTVASIALACVVILILILAGYTGVIWTRDEIAEHNAKENLLTKLREDLLNSLEAAGAISRQLSFNTGDITFVGDVEKVLHQQPEDIDNLIPYGKIIHPDDRSSMMGNIPWRHAHKHADWAEFVELNPEGFITVDNRILIAHDSSYVREWVKRSGSTAATQKREFRCLTTGAKGQEWRWKRSLSKLIPDPSGRGFCGENGILFDITEEYQMQSELVQAKYDAEAASRAKSDFLARMSHEIRTPMNAIIGMTHLTLRTQLNETQNGYQNKILKSSEKLLGIINDILDFSKIEAGKMELEDRPFRLDDVLNSVSDVVLINAQDKKLEMVFAIAEETPEWLVGDSLRLGQILINLANNAVKFTESGEILIRIEVSEQTEEEIKLLFSVTDSGIGMTQEQAQNLFQPFTQANGSITRKFGGTGLGLAISKSLVEAMGGSIWVESSPGLGSTFRFTAQLPLATDQKTLLCLPQDLRQLKALVIDDSEQARNSLTNMIGTIFATRPDAAESAKEALDLLSVRNSDDGSYDLIFVDWQMPATDGIETTRLLRDKLHQQHKQPFIVLLTSSYELESIHSEAKLAGVDAFLTKPNCPSDVFNTVAGLYNQDHNHDRSAHIKVCQKHLDQVRGTRVLLVDDNVFNQEVAKEFLQQAGMEVTIADNGYSALEAVESAPFDLVFMDIQMPDLDGLEVAQRIRVQYPATELPIVAITAHAMAGDREKSLAAGMNDHITKPIDPNELMAMLVKWGAKLHAVELEPAPQQNRIAHISTAKASPLFNFTEIDEAAGLRRCLDKTDSYQRFLALFYQEYHQTGKHCDDLMAIEQYEKVRHAAHAIRGPAGSIGAIKLHRSAQALEQAIWRRERDSYQQLYATFKTCLNKVLQELQPYVSSTLDQAKSNPGEAFFSTETALSYIEPLRSHLTQNDIAAANIISRLEPLSEDSLWAKMQREIRHFDFDQALATLQQIEADLAAESKQYGS